jgi:hypothetical protein
VSTELVVVGGAGALGGLVAEFRLGGLLLGLLDHSLDTKRGRKIAKSAGRSDGGDRREEDEQDVSIACDVCESFLGISNLLESESGIG